LKKGRPRGKEKESVQAMEHLRKILSGNRMLALKRTGEEIATSRKGIE
jgi:hypothetical protein